MKNMYNLIVKIFIVCDFLYALIAFDYNTYKDSTFMRLDICIE
jgi:hypothetical protein